MSYDIRLVDPVTNEPLHTKANHDMRGGMYAMGGTTELCLNTTWNYADYYYEATNGDKRFAHEEITVYANDEVEAEEKAIDKFIEIQQAAGGDLDSGDCTIDSLTEL